MLFPQFHVLGLSGPEVEYGRGALLVTVGEVR